MGFSVHVSPHISPHVSVPHISPHIVEPHVAPSPHFSEPSTPHTFVEESPRPSMPLFVMVRPHINNGVVSTHCDDGSNYCKEYMRIQHQNTMLDVAIVLGIVIFLLIFVSIVKGIRS
jgi:hypothetical protein